MIAKLSNRLCKRLLILSALLVGFLDVRAIAATADTPSEDMKIELDAVGDGTVTITDHYSARGWLAWQDAVGDHPDLAVREKKRDYAAWEITDVTFTKNDVGRTAESKMKVRALAQIAKNGDYVLDKLPRGLHLVTNTGNEWVFGGRSISAGQGDDVDLTIHVTLPPGATNVHVENPDNTETQLVYSVVAKTSKLSPLLLLAVLFGVVGAVLLALSSRLPGTVGDVPQLLAIRKVMQPSILLGGGRWVLAGRTPEGATLRLEITESMFSNNGNRLVIGRTGELCHVVIDTKSVSKQHAQIRREGSEFKIADRNSSNGTAVNGQFSRQPYDEVPFKEGDTLTLGDVKLDFSVG